MKTIGIDLGTTTISGVLFDTQSKKVISSKTLNHNAFITTKKDWERIQDVSKIIDTSVKIIQSFLEEYEEIEGIGLSGQMHGILYVDKNGKAMSPLYTWQDSRVQQEDLLKELQTSTTTIVASGYGLASHIYNVRNGLVPMNTYKLCTIMDYLGMVLTQRNVPLMHHSNSASLGFWKVREQTFDLEALEKLGMDISVLPECTKEIVSLGMYQNIPVTIAIGDNQASFLGSAQDENSILLNMGTGGQISMCSTDICEKPGIETRPFIHDKYLTVASSLCGGKAYALLETFFRSYVKEATGIDVSQYDIMERLACSNLDAPLFTTTFSGTRTDPAQKGSITNLSDTNFIPGNFIYGMMVGMVQELYDYYQWMPEGNENTLVLSGNGFRKNKVLCRIAQEIFGKEVILSQNKEEAATGAASLVEYIKKRK